MREPLSDVEMELLYRTTLEHVEREFKARAGEDVLTGAPSPASD